MKAQQQEKEFIALVEEYKQVIYKVCYIYASDPENLNDLYQEVVINLWKAFPRFRGECKASTWVYRIGLNTCISFFLQVKVQTGSGTDFGRLGRFCGRRR